MKEVKRLVPTHFTIKEAGDWIRYKGTGFTVEQIVQATQGKPDFSKAAQTIHGGIVLMVVSERTKKEYWAYALAFDDPAMGSGNFPRWDIYNGWTTELKNNA